jgi:hypothetical protein
MDNLGISFHAHLAGKTLEWFGMDTEKAYQYNIINRYDAMLENGWVDKKITYEFNEYGFRSGSFEEGDSIVFLGASDTLCTGVPLEDSWPYHVANNLNLKRYNLGLGGASGNTAFRMATYWLEKLKPKIVVLMSPLNVRFELADDMSGSRAYYQIGPNMFEKDSVYWGNFENGHLKSELSHFYKMWTSSEDNLFLLQKKNEMAIAHLASTINAKFVLADSDKDCKDIAVDLGRDLTHAGTKTNQLITNLILDRIG